MLTYDGSLEYAFFLPLSHSLRLKVVILILW